MLSEAWYYNRGAGDEGRRSGRPYMFAIGFFVTLFLVSAIIGAVVAGVALSA
jgi:hypothetical protein